MAFARVAPVPPATSGRTTTRLAYPERFGVSDANGDGRISQAEYANCWYGGGFYQTYNRATWEPSYRASDANGDGWLSPNEYWSASAWAQYDHNRDGVIDSSEWPW